MDKTPHQTTSQKQMEPSRDARIDMRTAKPTENN